MSDLSRLKQQIGAIARDAKSTAQGLAGFRPKFSSAVSLVSATIGGTTQRIDRKLIADLQTAQKAVDSAIQALDVASQEAEKFAQSL